jgi:hypothetical protein
MNKSSNQTDINGNKLYKEDKITFTYEGSSFDGRMELPKLTSQLRSTEILIKELINELYKQKKLTNPETKVYLELKKGSFQEIISIVFNHPFAIAVIGGSIVAIFNKLLNKTPKTKDTISNNIINNYGIINNINSIVNPLQNNDDKLTISLPDSQEKVINFDDKLKLSTSINNIKVTDESYFEIIEEEFFGNLNSVNVKDEKFGFIMEGSTKIIPTRFDDEPNLDEIKNILAERLKIKARAMYSKTKELKKLEIISYEIKKRKTLKEFFNK